jgi:hypothetical protein
MRKRELRFRKMALCVSGSLACAGSFIAFGVIAFSYPRASDIVGALIFSVFAYFFWLVAWQSAVRIDGVGIRVDNFLVRHYIPWGELADIAVGKGLEFRLRSGEKVYSLMFGGSIIGQAMGYGYTRRVASRMQAARQEILSEDRTESSEPLLYNSRFYMAPWPPVVILAATEIIAVLALATKLSSGYRLNPSLAWTAAS